MNDDEDEEVVKRDDGGRFAKGTTSPNPYGRPRTKRRKFTSDQTTADFLGLLERPVTLTRDGKAREVPAIVAIYERLIDSALRGDPQSIRKVVDLREKYTDRRTSTLSGLVTEAHRLRQEFMAMKIDVPEDLKDLIEEAELRSVLGQFKP